MSGSSGSHKTATAPSTPIANGQHYKRRYRPYFSKRQLSLMDQLNGFPSRRSHYAAAHSSNCKFIQQVGDKLGFPQTTISTSQALYHRFILYQGSREFQSLDLCITALFVASKMEENTKKLKDVYVVAHALRYPKIQELDPEKVSDDRLSRVGDYERQMLETLCFNFQIDHPYVYIVKFAKLLEKEFHIQGKSLAKKAYMLAVDSYRTHLCLEYPSHTIAAGCLYLASLMLEDMSYNSLRQSTFWTEKCFSRWVDIEEVGQRILDIYIAKPSEFGPSQEYTNSKIVLNELASQRPEQNNTHDKTKPWTIDAALNLDDLIAHTSIDAVSYLI
ncbi:cyclin-like protein [Hesseltinella vesiculosa]|uniref:Cyclin-like protein n=1 Tax=Hesseltinella vesiculosa TaxID=101127 RepID=A0A1X2GCW6_9FUNG|nr:cyclin-like protein [Hesseltinella vesiculosa]